MTPRRHGSPQQRPRFYPARSPSASPTRAVALMVALVLLPLAGGCGALLRDNPVVRAARAQQQTQNFAAGQERYQQMLFEAVRALQGGKTGAAERALNQALLLFGGDAPAYAQVGSDLIERGRAADAVRLLERAVRDDRLTEDPALWAVLARAAGQTGNTVRQTEASRQARARAEAILAGDAGTGLHRSPQEKAAAAQRLYRAGVYYHEIGELPRALSAWRAALALAPDDPHLLNTLGYTLADEGTTRAEWDESLLLTREALKRAPGHPAIRDSYGWALYRTGDLQAARRQLRAAVDQAPDMAELRYHLGVVYAALGQTREARNELLRARRIQPDHQPTQQALARLPPEDDAPEKLRHEEEQQLPERSERPGPLPSLR